MKEEEIRKRRIENEEKQEENTEVTMLLERKIEDCGQLYASERHHNERVMAYFYRQKEGSFLKKSLKMPESKNVDFLRK
ncbi:hypothetical protein IGL98_002304 [Enterococcus sp. DIV0840]|uniref:hypothetical protein n=1 Tax=Enterococcus TaxID=1350 RepID=UPI001A8EE2FF|nr:MULTISPECIES: hypothetical protein [Enterococcus]MBO0433275.1 hypothetical protein [Enterococcus sp. DIV0849a]MBO0473435.1 hypothetical protein [Enterococcus ureasiticus]